MDLGFIGLGNMGRPMADRLVAAGHRVTVYDTRSDAVDAAVAGGAMHGAVDQGRRRQRRTVLASLPTPAVSQQVATGPDGVIAGARVKLFVDLSTVGSQGRTQSRPARRARHRRVRLPGQRRRRRSRERHARLMVSGPRADSTPSHRTEAIGRPIFVGEQPGAAQTMKLVNNLVAATTLAATAEVMVMGVKAGLDRT